MVKSLYPSVEIYWPQEASRLADTRAYFPSREEAERFARHFDERRYHIDISAEPRTNRQVYRVHVQQLDTLHPAASAAALTGRGLNSPRGFHDYRSPPSALSPLTPGVAPIGVDLLARRMGRSLGQAVAQKEANGPLPRRVALARLGTLLDACGMGNMSLLSTAPLVVRVSALSPSAVEDRGSRCGHLAGFLEGAIEVLLGQKADVREIDCVSLGNPYCTFACGP